jgi:hypothetical protein
MSGENAVNNSALMRPVRGSEVQVRIAVALKKV